MPRQLRQLPWSVATRVGRSVVELLEPRRLLAGATADAPSDGGTQAAAVETLAATQGLQTTYGSNGLKTLTYNGVTLLDTSVSRYDGFRVRDFRIRRSTGAIETHITDPAFTTSWDAAQQRLTLTYSWGRVSTQYVQSGDRLNLNITVSNTTSGDTLLGINLFPLSLNFPSMPVGFDRVNPQVGFNISGPTAVGANYGQGLAVVANDDVARPLYAGLWNNGDTGHWDVWAGSYPLSYQPSSWPAINRPIAPASSDTYALSLRFAPASATTTAVASDVYQNYAAAFPFQVNWADRRPIASLLPAASATSSRTSTNPRGWFNDPTINVLTADGLAIFRTRLLAYADQSVAILKQMNAQGAVTWDIEGEQYTTATYVGDPRVATQMAPELSYLGVVDDYFRKFRDAALRVGLTIRPQQLQMSTFTQLTSPDPFQTLNDKVNFAQQRWGCTLFYIDSNNQYDAAVVKRVADLHPDSLFIPEHESNAHFAYGTPYGEVNLGYLSTGSQPRQLYSGSFSIINTGVTPLGPLRDTLAASVRNGDILMFQGWWNNPNNEIVKQIYAGGPPAVPGGLVASSTSRNTVSLSWADVAGEDGYTLQRSDNGVDGWANVATLGLDQTSYQDTGLADGSRYYYRVSSFNSDGASGYSPGALAITLLPAPTGLSASAVSNSQVNLTWSDASNGETGFAIQRSRSGGDWLSIGSAGANQTSFSATGLSAGVQYFFRVQSVTSVTTSAWSNTASATPSSLSALWRDSDIGAPQFAGSAVQTSASSFTLTGSGDDIWSKADSFHFLYQPMNGDGQIIARVASVQRTNNWAKAGVMIRETLGSSSKHASMFVTAAQGVSFQRRLATGASSTSTTSGGFAAPYWVKLVRSGPAFTGYRSSDGVSWIKIGSDTINMAANVYVGLALTAHNNNQLNTSTFDNVSVVP